MDRTSQGSKRVSYRANRAVGAARKEPVTSRALGSARQVFYRFSKKIRQFKATHAVNYKRVTVAAVIVLACIMTPIIAAVATNTGKVVSEESRQIAAVETQTAVPSQDKQQNSAQKSSPKAKKSTAPKQSTEPKASEDKSAGGDVIQQQLNAKNTQSATTSESPKESAKAAKTESTKATTTEIKEDKKDDTKKTIQKDVELKPGVTSPQVEKLQSRLMELDYMEEDEPTKYYGYITEYAVQLFQRKHNLEIDGIAGKTTTDLLYSKDAKHYTVSLGITGTDVEQLQERLQELGYLKSGASGYFGTDTEQAVKDFQKRNGLDADGNVGANTREALYAEDAREAVKDTSGGDSDTKKETKKETKKDTNNDTKKKSTSKREKSTTRIPDDKSVSSLIAMAKSLIGSPYVRGGKGPNSFDCSGFVYYCLNRIGYNINYMTSGGWAGCSLPKVTSIGDLKAGDIVCFRGHVGIFIGGGRMIDASSSQGQVRMSRTLYSSSYWKNYFICGRRVL